MDSYLPGERIGFGFEYPVIGFQLSVFRLFY